MNYMKLSESLAKAAADFIAEKATKNHLGIVMSRYFIPESWNSAVADFDDIGDYLHYMKWYENAFSGHRRFAEHQLAIWDGFRSRNLYNAVIKLGKKIFKNE